MKLLSLATLSIAAVAAEQEGYGSANDNPYPKAAEPVYYSSYDPYTGGHEPAQNYGYSPYPPHQQNYAKYHHANYIEPVYPPKQKPNPFIHYPKDDHNDLRIPHLGNYHCFLTGAPWTKCGRRTLTSYFLDQCMVFYYSMSTNVDGICGDKKPEEAAVSNDYYREKYGNYNEHYGKPASVQPKYDNPAPAYENETPEPTPAPFVSGYGGTPLSSYQKERCLQNAYVSITTALALCLTENMVRIKYIEHYAKDAATNPIEGPILYLKKLHTFIRSVLSCTGKSAVAKYPNLWNDFHNADGVLTYSPNMPYVVNDDGAVVLDQHMSAESTGFNDITVNNYFLCNNVPDINDDGIYESDAGNKHYDLLILDTCSKSRAYDVLGYDEVIKRCPLIVKNTGRGSPKGANGQYYADTTLESLYEAVNPVTRQSTAAFRIRTIAELAVGNTGVFGEPLLEGFGVMYFCGFYACKANNGGDLDGTCFPSFDCESDWTVPSQVGGYDDFNEYGDKIEYCLEKKYLTKEDVAGNDKVRVFKKLLRRSHTCMSENTVVDFYKELVDTDDHDEAWAQVYFRHLAVEKCYEEEHKLCASNVALYQALLDALEDLEKVCSTRRNDYHARKHYTPSYPAHNPQPPLQYSPVQPRY